MITNSIFIPPPGLHNIMLPFDAVVFQKGKSGVLNCYINTQILDNEVSRFIRNSLFHEICLLNN